MKGLKFEKIGSRIVCIEGIGKMFYENGFPLCMAIEKLIKLNIEVSVLHVADELLKNKYSPETVYKKIKEDLQLFSNDTYDFASIQKFCFSDYESQRKMIFDFLFNNEKEAKQHLSDLIDLI